MIENYDAIKLEPEVLEFWKRNGTYPKAKKKNEGGKKFYFLDGPPYTSGKGRKIAAGSIIKYVVTQGSDIIRNRVKLPDEVTESDYDSDYYIHNQVVPAVERIFNVLGYTKEDLLETKDQTKLGGFF